MTANFHEIRDAVLCLTGPDKVRLPASVVMDVTGAYPGIDFQEGVCGGAARIIRTRIPVWTLETARRQGMTDAAVLAAFPSLTAEDLTNAWAYARSHRAEMDGQITANGDDPLCEGRRGDAGPRRAAGCLRRRRRGVGKGESQGAVSS